MDNFIKEEFIKPESVNFSELVNNSALSLDIQSKLVNVFKEAEIKVFIADKIVD